LNLASSIFNGCAYVILSLAITYYGWKLKALIINQSVKVPFLKSRWALFALTILLSIIFLIRGIWNFLLATEYVHANIQIIPVILFGCPCPNIRDQLITTFLLILWEVLPSTVMLGIFWKIPKAKPIKPFRNNPPFLINSYVPVSNISISHVDSTTETVQSTSLVNIF
jgi:hypothetical protein